MLATTILLVDDHRLIRECWTAILNQMPGFQIIEAVSSAEEAIAVATREKPAIVLMDINMEPMNGFDATKAIRKFSPGSKVIAVSMHAMPAYAKKIIQMGAVGYVTKNSAREELIMAINEVMGGAVYICQEVKEILTKQSLNEKEDMPNINLLSKREIEIARLLKEGLTSKEIAAQLEVSSKTVEVHRFNIIKKLSLKNTAALVNYMNTQGF